MDYNDNKKIPVAAIVGPTASGKTALSVELAKRFNAEIVSADSMQIYKGMDIASAKPTADEMQGITHHLIDFLPSDEKYSVAKYVLDAKKVINEIHSRKKNVLLCGGTGLYVDSLLQNIVFEEQEDNTQIRAELKARRNEEGIEKLYSLLCEIDPESAQKLHINNEGRIIRALERYYLTGEKPSVLDIRSRQIPSEYDSLYICLDYKDRSVLYDRINRRVDLMIQNGLIEEAAEYYALKKDHTSSQAIGHKELIPFLDGSISLDEAVENLKKATRHYAKRQLTWFRRNKEMHYIYCDFFDSFDEEVEAAAKIIEEYGQFKAGDAD